MGKRTALLLAALAGGCARSSASEAVDDIGGSDSGSDSTVAVPDFGDEWGTDGWIDPGYGVYEYNDLEDGDDFPIYFGTQDLWMFAMQMRGGGFPMGEDPLDWQDPLFPQLEAWIDIHGYDGLDDGMGHFASVHDFPLTMEPISEDTYQYLLPYIALLLPEQLESFDEILDKPALLHVEVRTADGQLLTADREVRVVMADPD